jgi:hypothetical protein
MSRFDERMHILDGHILIYNKKIMMNSDSRVDENLIKLNTKNKIGPGDFVLNNKIEVKWATRIYSEFASGSSESADNGDLVFWALRVALGDFPETASISIIEKVVRVNGHGYSGSITLKPFMVETEDETTNLIPLTFSSTKESTRTIPISDFDFAYRMLPSMNSLGGFIDAFGKTMLTFFTLGLTSGAKVSAKGVGIVIKTKQFRRAALKKLLKHISKSSIRTASLVMNIVAEISKELLKLYHESSQSKKEPARGKVEEVIRRSISKNIAEELTGQLLKPLKSAHLFPNIENTLKREISNYVLKTFVSQTLKSAVDICVAIPIPLATDLVRGNTRNLESDIHQHLKSKGLSDILTKETESLLTKFWDNPNI